MPSSLTTEQSRGQLGEKRVCLLTGAGGTLGSALCRLYARNYSIVAVYRSGALGLPSQRERFVDPLSPLRQVPQNANRIYAVRADVGNGKDLDWLVEVALARFGRIDLLVNAAAATLPADWTDSVRLGDNFEEQMRVNALVPIKLAAIVARKFWRDRASENATHNRNVINVSSTSGLYIFRRPTQGLYSASKAALNFLSVYQAQEFWRFRVRVNVLAPTSFPELIPTEQVAASLVQLDQARINGSVMVVDTDGSRFAYAPPPA